MAGWETLLAAVGGLVLGAGVAGVWQRQHERRILRAKVDLETRVRRSVVPVLERRADVLGIPPAERGAHADAPLEIAVTLASAIQAVEETAELPYGDTVEISRDDVSEARSRADARIKSQERS